jgi:hypothetical protein
MTNIGSAEWKDYHVEFEFCMGGVDPAFNPHALPADFCGGSVHFHVSDAKESWNERGNSNYSLNLGGDGAWNLTCSYSAYCKGACGFDNPVSEGGRTVVEGKGLKTDPVAGNKIRLEVCGTRIQIWVDGQLIVDVQDKKMGETIGGQTLDHGGIGISWGFESMGWIRNFSAKPI